MAVAAVLALASCSSEPQWADPEAHEKTEELQQKYVPLLIGTWHYEHLADKYRFFEQLTFNDDNTFTGYRKWQSRALVTVEGQEVYTDWKDIEEECGTFTGEWSLRYTIPSGGEKEDKCNCLSLWATFDDEDNHVLPHSSTYIFNYVDETTLSFQCNPFHGTDDWTSYHRGEGGPSF